MPLPRPPCGTNGGYHAHHRRDEEACEDCTEAHRLYELERRRSHGVPARTEPLCGTDAGYHRHRRAEPPTEPCDACRAAHAATSAEGRR